MNKDCQSNLSWRLGNFLEISSSLMGLRNIVIQANGLITFF
jgi:hypothetical protein